jgi:hypothetical protein
MDVGYGTGTTAPPVATSIILSTGSAYEMSHHNGWHSVEPIGEPTYTVMVTGVPWKRASPKSSYSLRPLSGKEKIHLFEVFGQYYGQKVKNN